jgi:hypothetical protein
VAYIGNDLQVAFSTYKNIDDISGSFDGVTTSFALLVNGVAPAPLPLNSNQCLISVGGVVQRPDDTGTEGFRLSGGNIVFSSAPNTAEDFFGIILAGADYVNVGANFPDGTLGAPSITFDQDNDTGYYRSGSGAVSFASNGVAAGTWSSAGVTAPALIPTGSSVPANGVYLPAANTVGVATNGVERVEFGTGEVVFNDGGANYDFRIEGDTNANLFFVDASAEAVGIGTASPGSAFEVKPSASSATLGIQAGTINTDSIRIQSGGTANTYLEYRGYLGHAWFVDATERARIDSSGRLLIGTSSARDKFFTGSQAAASQVEGNSTNTASISITRNDAGGDTPYLIMGHARGTGNQVVIADDGLGRISFQGADGTNFIQAASIGAFVDGTPGTNDMPGRLVFSTTADGASSPTERMRITNGGSFRINQTTTDDPAGTNTQGLAFGSAGWISNCRDGATPVLIGRKGNDGTLVEFAQDGTYEGNISVSGTTVSYNGAHLSRWSQLPSGAERTEILRGSVLSNLDEMCEWGEEENEQLNRMKVSDVEGDKNVSGVFQAWDDDDDTYINDFYCAMTGDFVIRIAQGVTVERGDLLMSAGDGTAKPQDDDIIRNKTIAKVTSTNVSCTYDDGSYCVPCVLMAC